jgi:hypothetical protein
MPNKRVHIDPVVFGALELLKKHRRPIGLANALKQSLHRLPANTNSRRRPGGLVHIQ